MYADSSDEKILKVRVSTIVWWHHLNFKKLPEEKVRSEFYNTICSFEKILKAALYKIATVQPLTTHLRSKTNKKWWELEWKQG